MREPYDDPTDTFYQRVGGHDVFEALTAAFYEGVANDRSLRPMYPEDDLEPAERRLRMFLEQYWGGPTDYSEERGHPRLRMRHAPYRITEAARDRWLEHMRAAMDELNLDPDQDAEFWAYLVMAAHSLVNAADDEGTGGAGAGADPAGPVG